ncbi:MAG: hypothetical protein WEA76_01190 [Acidimicrobiia bacterium]
MDFRGHLRLPDDAGIGIPVLLCLDDIFVVISSGGDELGAWRADDVVVERLHSNQFAIELDGEPAVFVAQDALGFAYDGILAIESLQERLTKRRVFKRSKRKRSAEDAETAVEASSAAQTEDVASTPEPAAGVAEPKFTIAPEPIWTPPPTPSAPSVSAYSAPNVPVPHPVRPVAEPDLAPERRFESEDFDAPPPDARVSYPQAEKPAPPAVESFVPPAVSAEPEYELEEVTAAERGAESFRSDEDSSEGADSEPEIEYDEYVLPVAGVVDIFASSIPAEQVPEVVVEPPDDDGVEMAATEVEVDRSVPTDGVVRSHGHGAVRELSERSGTRERRRSLFGRGKRARAHDHVYGDPKTIGGLTRQVCDICGHVTFSGEDAYQGW